jgi:hypothetical protein
MGLSTAGLKASRFEFRCHVARALSTGEICRLVGRLMPNGVVEADDDGRCGKFVCHCEVILLRWMRRSRDAWRARVPWLGAIRRPG